MLEREEEDQKPDYLSNLDPELKNLIFGFLPPRDLMQLQLVNKSVGAVAEDMAGPKKAEVDRKYITLLAIISFFSPFDETQIRIENAQVELKRAIFAILLCKDNKTERQKLVDDLYFKLIRVSQLNWVKAESRIQRIGYQPSRTALDIAERSDSLRQNGEK